MAGFIINRFRGDLGLFTDGVQWIEQKTGLPVFGVLPWYDHIRIDPEDSVVIEQPSAVTLEDSKALGVIDVETGAMARMIGTDQNVTHMVALDPAGKRAYTANIGSGSITVVDLDGGERVRNVATGAGAEGVAVAAGGRQIWVTNREADTITVLDAETLEAVKELTVAIKGPLTTPVGGGFRRWIMTWKLPISGPWRIVADYSQIELRAAAAIARLRAGGAGEGQAATEKNQYAPGQAFRIGPP